ncbi:MAG: ROK family protein, partial [Chloroflexota bacterium]
GSVVNLRGEIKETVDFPVDESDGEQAIQLLYKILDQLVNENWKPLIGIGIGTPGLVNTREGIVVNAVNLDWQDFHLAKLLETRYALPVKVLNDSQATAIGEFVYSEKHQSEDNLIVVTVRHGIGAGILINGSLFQGDGGGAGEIGHVVVEEDGELCQCGKYGCLQTVASAQAIVKRAVNLATEYNNSDLAKYPQNISLDAIETAWKSNDPLARRVVTDAAVFLGKSFANLVGVLNIHKIVLSGDIVRFGEPCLEIVRDAMSNATLTRLAMDTQVEVGQLEFRGCILGASAFMLLENYSLLFTKD